MGILACSGVCLAAALVNWKINDDARRQEEVEELEADASNDAGAHEDIDDAKSPMLRDTVDVRE